MAPPRTPDQIKIGTLRFRVWPLGDGRLASDYEDATGKRRVIKRSSIEDLRAELELKATGILNAETAAQDLTAEDRRIYVAAREALASLGSVDSIARDAAEALSIVGAGVSLRDLANYYTRHHTTKLADRTVAQMIVAMRAEKEEADLSGRRKRALRNDLKKLEDTFGGRLIGQISTDEILQWVRDLQHAGGFAWKRRNDLRDAAVCLFRYAQDRGFLPSDRKTAAEIVPRLPKPKRGPRTISTYSPDEMRAFIANVQPRFLPWLLICGFSGIRSEEVAPDKDSNKDGLRWEDFRWAKRYINVRAETAKIRDQTRHVPITDQLLAWLEPWHRKTGHVCPGEQPSKRETGRLGRISGAEIDGRWVRAKWKQNALRHTLISALLGLRDEKGQPVNSRAYVAEICGTSEAKIRSNYREPMEPEAAAAWLGITPKMPSNVIQASLL